MGTLTARTRHFVDTPVNVSLSTYCQSMDGRHSRVIGFYLDKQTF